MQDTVKEIVWELLINKILVALPFLNIPIIRTVFKWIFRKFFDLVYDELMLFGAFIRIELKVNEQKEKYEQATIELKQAIDTKTGVESAKDNYKKHLANLISFKL